MVIDEFEKAGRIVNSHSKPCRRRARQVPVIYSLENWEVAEDYVDVFKRQRRGHLTTVKGIAIDVARIEELSQQLTVEDLTEKLWPSCLTRRRWIPIWKRSIVLTKRSAAYLTPRWHR